MESNKIDIKSLKMDVLEAELKRIITNIKLIESQPQTRRTRDQIEKLNQDKTKVKNKIKKGLKNNGKIWGFFQLVG